MIPTAYLKTVMAEGNVEPDKDEIMDWLLFPRDSVEFCLLLIGELVMVDCCFGRWYTCIDTHKTV